MSYSKNTRLILDCTLRDGGYVNNWEFDTATAVNIMNGLYESGVRYIELGIVGKGGEPGKCTKFSDFCQVEPLLKYRKNDCSYALMLNQADVNQFDIPQRSKKTVDLLRLAFFKREAEDALNKAIELKNKGYKVFLQAMATFMYSEQELDDLIVKINNIKPNGFYMVDSFSTMYNHDVREMVNSILPKLSDEILFGFHAHNNMQMAYSNVIEFFSTKTERPLIADGSIYGMGRGAGNVPTELLMEYLNKYYGCNYKIIDILSVFQENIKPIFEKYYWGFSPEYYLTASKNMNSVYGWYLNNHGVKDLKIFNDILDKLPEDVRYTLVRAAADELLQKMM